MSIDLDDLKAACYETARMAMWQRRPIPASSIQDLGNEFYAVAAERAKEHHEIGEDAEVVNRAVWYLAQVHASPPMNTDVRWFTEMLSALLELALHNANVAEGKPKKFLEDLLKGIKWSIENPFDPEKTQHPA